MKKLLILLFGIIVALPAICQTKLADVQIIKEWNGRKEIPVTHGTVLDWKVSDDTARYLKSDPAKNLRSRTIIYDPALPFPGTPATPIPNPTDDTTAIDGFNAKFFGKWTNGKTTTPTGQVVNIGWYKNTIAYSNTSGDSVSFKFIGTAIELHGEKLPTHGTGLVRIDKGQWEAVSYKSTTKQLPAKIFEKTGLSDNVTHTITLKVTLGYCLLDFFVVKNYKAVVGDITPTIPAPSIPAPTGEVINVNPGQNIKQIIETASNKTIKLNQGTYVTEPFFVPVTVNLFCDNAIIATNALGTEGSGARLGIANLNSGSRANGNQSIRGCIFDGRNTAYAAIMSSNRDNVIIESCYFKDTNFTAVWIRSASGTKVLNCTFENASWADDRYMAGALMINNISDYLIENNTFTSNKNSKGTGIESNSLVKESTLTRGKILNNKFRLSKHNPWGGGRSQNFSMEFHDMHLRVLEIAYNDMENEISLASHRSGNGSITHIHHNTGNLAGNLFCVETVADDLLIENNNWSGASMLVANYQPNGVWKNWIIRNNILTNSTPPVWGAPILIGPNGVQNVLIQNNQLPTPLASAVKFMGVQGGVTIN